MAVNWVQWLPKAFKFSSVLHFIMATVMASIWHVYIFGVYLVLETHVCQYSHIRRLYQKSKKLFSQCPKKTFWGRWLSPFAGRHFSNSHCPAWSLPGMLVGRENMRSAKWSWRGKRTVWVDANILWGFGEWGWRWMWKEGVGGTSEDTSRIGEGFRWGNGFLGMCYFWSGVTTL